MHVNNAMNKKLIIGVSSMLLALSTHSIAFANDVNLEARAQAIKDVTVFVSENVSRVTGMPRGRLISSMELSIADMGGGVVDLYGNVLCHEPMQEIQLNLYLDQWLTDNEEWEQLERFTYNWKAEDYPDEDLTMAMAYATVGNLDRGEEYRLRGLAGVWDLDSTLSEVWSEETDSILVE